MGQDYDKIIKENIEGVLLPLAKEVLGLPEPEGIIEIPDDLQYTIERKPDFLKIITNANGESLFILHLEFQTRDENDMLSRMLFYAAQLYGKYKLPIKQYVFYIGKRPAQMRRELEQEDLFFRFHVRNVVDVPYQAFLDTDKPEEMVLAILGDLGKEAPQKAIQQILTTIKASETSQLVLGRYFRQIEVLSKLRNIQQQVIKQIEAMAIVYDLETDIRYLQGKKKGAEEATAPAMLRGLQEGRHEAKREDVIGLLRLSVLTNEQIAQALNVSTDFVLTIQAGMRPSAANE